MSPYHHGYVRELRSTTALRLSASWIVSENVRRIRDAEGTHYDRETPDFYGGILADAAIERTKSLIQQVRS